MLRCDNYWCIFLSVLFVANCYIHFFYLVAFNRIIIIAIILSSSSSLLLLCYNILCIQDRHQASSFQAYRIVKQKQTIRAFDTYPLKIDWIMKNNVCKNLVLRAGEYSVADRREIKYRSIYQAHEYPSLSTSLSAIHRAREIETRIISNNYRRRELVTMWCPLNNELSISPLDWSVIK